MSQKWIDLLPVIAAGFKSNKEIMIDIDILEAQAMTTQTWRNPFDPDIILELIARLRKAEAQGWQDIATAPRDGTEVDVWHKYSGRTTDAAYLNGAWRRLLYPTQNSVREIMDPQPSHYKLIDTPIK